MGRGTGNRQLLHLLPLTNVAAPAASPLSLPLFKGGVFEFNCDSAFATLRLYDADHFLLDESHIPRLYLYSWLRAMEDISSLTNTYTFFGHFEFSWADDDTALHVYTRQGDSTVLLDIIASWEALRDFLNAARSHGLF